MPSEPKDLYNNNDIYLRSNKRHSSNFQPMLLCLFLHRNMWQILPRIHRTYMRYHLQSCYTWTKRTQWPTRTCFVRERKSKKKLVMPQKGLENARKMSYPPSGGGGISWYSHNSSSSGVFSSWISAVSRAASSQATSLSVYTRKKENKSEKLVDFKSNACFSQFIWHHCQHLFQLILIINTDMDWRWISRVNCMLFSPAIPKSYLHKQCYFSIEFRSSMA